ncbi:hypothetical protein [Pseudomonas syringae]|uniref:hypothetical protein n=1 Tax=Pseudomonas syringae TaxID=317 RepID=UPI0004E69051|nr:hypothetical protein [Pseudomonas syringae]KFF82333.1 hypothetical protein HM80_17845 [Pseudomonas syringae pv. syringae]
MEFLQEPQNFAVILSSVKRDWAKAEENFFFLVGHWQGLCVNHFGGLISIIKVDEKSVLQGVVLNKSYAVELRPIAIKGKGFAEVVIKVLFSQHEVSEAGRFLVDRNGSVVQEDGSVVVDADTDLGSARIFTTIVNAVLETPYPSSLGQIVIAQS